MLTEKDYKTIKKLLTENGVGKYFRFWDEEIYGDEGLKIWCYDGYSINSIEDAKRFLEEIEE